MSRRVWQVIQQRWPGMIAMGHFHLYVLPPEMGTTAYSDEADIRQITPVDLPALVECRDMTDTATGVAVFQARLDAGCHGYLLREGATVTGYLWMSRGTNRQEDEDRYRLWLGTRGGYLFDAYVQPAGRGKGRYRRLLTAARRQEAAQNVEVIVLTIDDDNHHSRQVHIACGAFPIEGITYMHLFGWSLHCATGIGGTYAQLDPPGQQREFISRAVIPR